MQDAAAEVPVNESEPEPFRGPRWKRRIFGAVSLLFLILIAIAWWQRISIADRFVQQELDARNVRASYEIIQIGVRTQQIRNLVIGDPANPDLTARLVEVDVAINFSGAVLRDVRAYDVKLKGLYDGERLSFGELDKFADPDSNEPFEWPDIGLIARNVQARIDTPWGVVGAGLDGKGLLRNRFVADLALRSPRLAGAGCTAPTVRFDGQLSLEWRQPRFVGPLRADRLDCAELGLAIAYPRLDADIKLSERFNKWVGKAGLAAVSARYGDMQLAGLAGSLSVDGGASRTNIALAVDRGALRSAPLSARQFMLDSQGYIGVSNGRLAYSMRGEVDLSSAALDRGTLLDPGGIVQQTRGTPVGPLMARIAPVLGRAGDNFRASLDFEGFQDFQGRSGATLAGLAIDSASGARLRQQGSLALQNGSDGWRLQSAAQLALSGRDLPDARLTLAPASGDGWRGNLVIAPFAGGNASLAVPGLAFAGRPRGNWSLDGRARLSGPLAGGLISNLDLPIRGSYGNGRLALYQSCETIAFGGYRVSGLQLRGQSLRLCPDRGRSIVESGASGTRLVANIAGLNARGTLGGAPLDLQSAQVRFSLSDGFVARNVQVDLGNRDTLTELDLAVLTGMFGPQGMRGTLSGGSGRIGNVPLLIDEVAGDWRYLAGVLNLDAGLRVLDAAQVDRFQPMRVPDMMLSLENNVITAIGHLVEPETGTHVADVDIRHDLSAGRGRALLAVDGLRFNDRLQPDQLTPLALGVVANVDGAVFGDGRIDWGPGGVTSSGRFATRGMNLAAAFGPVEGLTTEIVFTDLLGLETAPGQVATIASVNPGITALNGLVNYRLLPNQQVAVEGGRWPFAGGELILEPTTLDFSAEKDRRLTFRVVGVDAEKLLASYDFENLRVSGVFDGTLPMVFDQDGGRIVAGALVSRPGGGEVSYVGEISYKDMGAFANFAFDALRSIRYSTLTIGVGGDIDGEIITNISFTGLQQGSLAKRNYITNQLARIPIQFNVSITAEFLKLISSIRGIYDPEFAAKRDLPFLIQQERGDPPVDEATREKDERNDE
jgi:translocation and assembly module TamB